MNCNETQETQTQDERCTRVCAHRNLVRKIKPRRQGLLPHHDLTLASWSYTSLTPCKWPLAPGKWIMSGNPTNHQPCTFKATNGGKPELPYTLQCTNGGKITHRHRNRNWAQHHIECPTGFTNVVHLSWLYVCKRIECPPGIHHESIFLPRQNSLRTRSLPPSPPQTTRIIIKSSTFSCLINLCLQSNYCYDIP